MSEPATIAAVIFGMIGSLKLLLDLWKTHFAPSPPLYRQFADREEMRIELEKLHIAIAALRKETDDKRGKQHLRIDTLAHAVSYLTGKLELHLKENRA